MTKRKDPEKRQVTELALSLDADPAWTGGLLIDLGIPVDSRGRYPAQRLRRLLDGIRSASPAHDLVNEPVKRLMGNTEESCRRWLTDELSTHGIKVIHREEHRNSRFTVKLPNGSKMLIATYVALKTKAHPGQVGFRAGPGKRGDVYDWYLFLAWPFGRVYVRSRKEMHSRWNKNHTGPMGHMSVTFSAGQTADLLENRIVELVEGR